MLNQDEGKRVGKQIKCTVKDKVAQATVSSGKGIRGEAEGNEGTEQKQMDKARRKSSESLKKGGGKGAGKR